MSSFYGDIKVNPQISLVFDKTYPNRKAMEDAIKKNNLDGSSTGNINGDGVYNTRYVFINYGDRRYSPYHLAEIQPSWYTKEGDIKTFKPIGERPELYAYKIGKSNLQVNDNLKDELKNRPYGEYIRLEDSAKYDENIRYYIATNNIYKIDKILSPDGIDENWPFRCGVLRTEDNGKSFHIEGYLKAQTPLWENNIAEYENGKLVMLMRAEFTGYLYRSFSDDYGKTWTKPEKTDIPNPASKITLLKSGNNILLIHNPTMCQEFCDWNKRKPLEMWVSSDGTRTWNKKIPLTKVDEPFFYPHGFVDSQKNLIYIACENSQEHFLLKIPINEIEGQP